MQQQHLQQLDPFALPDCRWQQAGRIAAGELPHRHGLDDALKAAIAYRRRELGDASPGRRRRPGPHDAAISAALELRQADGPVAWEARARILAGQSDAEIAARCGLTPECIAWYAALFFDVRPKLKAFAYIVARVIGRARGMVFRPMM